MRSEFTRCNRILFNNVKFMVDQIVKQATEYRAGKPYSSRWVVANAQAAKKIMRDIACDKENWSDDGRVIFVGIPTQAYSSFLSDYDDVVKFLDLMITSTDNDRDRVLGWASNIQDIFYSTNDYFTEF